MNIISSVPSISLHMGETWSLRKLYKAMRKVKKVIKVMGSIIDLEKWMKVVGGCNIYIIKIYFF